MEVREIISDTLERLANVGSRADHVEAITISIGLQNLGPPMISDEQTGKAAFIFSARRSSSHELPISESQYWFMSRDTQGNGRR